MPPKPRPGPSVYTFIPIPIGVVNWTAAQTPLTTTLVIDIQNEVDYQEDVSNSALFATNPNPTPSAGFRNFGLATLIGDIVAVNGRPAKGTYFARIAGVKSSPAPVPGGAIADVTRTAQRQSIFEILQPNGTPIGSIMTIGLSGGPAPPSDASTERANFAIAGGTGAFLGARGQEGGTGGAGRAASITEDPANRRVNGGNPNQYILHIPMRVPEIVAPVGGPAIVHSDSTPVTSSHPASPNEILFLIATGMGPVKPGVEPGTPFPDSPPAVVNSPLLLTLNDVECDVFSALGYPGTVNGYQVEFRIPPNAASGLATLQLTVAWIVGPPVTINIGSTPLHD